MLRLVGLAERLKSALVTCTVSVNDLVLAPLVAVTATWWVPALAVAGTVISLGYVKIKVS